MDSIAVVFSSYVFAETRDFFDRILEETWLAEAAADCFISSLDELNAPATEADLEIAANRVETYLRVQIDNIIDRRRKQKLIVPKEIVSHNLRSYVIQSIINEDHPMYDPNVMEHMEKVYSGIEGADTPKEYCSFCLITENIKYDTTSPNYIEDPVYFVDPDFLM